jgi:uncharacterized damage-inducible protein DinB
VGVVILRAAPSGPRDLTSAGTITDAYKKKMPQALTELLRGKGAHADPITCIEDISPNLANQHIENFPHTIADLVFHMNYWMAYELARIHGEKRKYPEHNAESFPTKTTKEEDWERIRSEFTRLLSEFATLAQLPRAELDRQIEPSHEADKNLAGTLESVLWQMVAHNSYHIGQIATIRRALGAWPPRAGGDTW